MTKREKILSAIFITVIMAVVVSLNLNLQGAQGAAPTGYETMIATSSSITANTSVALVAFASTTGCTSRVLNTPSNVRVAFGDNSGFALSATVGHRLTATSSPYLLDAGVYGCGQVTVFAETGTPVMQVTEFKGFR